MKNSGKKTGPEFLLARVMQPFEEDRLHGHNTKSTLPSKVLKNLPIPPAVKASAKSTPERRDSKHSRLAGADAPLSVTRR